MSSRRRWVLAVLTAVALVASVPAVHAGVSVAADGKSAIAPVGSSVATEIEDATVIAIIDYQPLSFYHHDMVGKHLPQHVDGNASNDLPLHRPPDQWIPGFPDRKSRGWEVQRLDIDLDRATPGADRESLWRADRAKWDTVRRSDTAADPNFYWVPGSKVIGALSFGSDGLAAEKILASEDVVRAAYPDGHGVGTSSSAAGNLHGTCPECLVVFIEVDVSGIEVLPEAHDPARAEEALRWALSQPWIDVVSTAWSLSATPATRDRVYNSGEAAIAVQRDAAERGQTMFVSSGNGHDAVQSVVPTATYMSATQGPDWNITVSGTEMTNERNATKAGYGKLVDLSGPGVNGYPSAYGSPTVNGRRDFDQTSNAVSVAAGIYGKALYESRRALVGASRSQRHGVIARGEPFTCGEARSDCELHDGILTAEELRTRFLLGTREVSTGYVAGVPHPTEEVQWASEGHGTYRGRCKQKRDTSLANELQRPVKGVGFDCEGANPGLGEKDVFPHITEWYEREFDPQLLGPLKGTAAATALEEEKENWFIVDSWCRQKIWGSWDHGYWKGEDDERPLHLADPLFPLRSSLLATCSESMRPPQKPEPTLEPRPDVPLPTPPKS